MVCSFLCADVFRFHFPQVASCRSKLGEAGVYCHGEKPAFTQRFKTKSISPAVAPQAFGAALGTVPMRHFESPDLEPVISASSRKNPPLRADEMSQFTGTLW
jgi:hypothetical protein